MFARARAVGASRGYTGSASMSDPLHGVTLQMILERLVERLGWERMGQAVEIRCFTHDPSIASSLKFLRRTPWARAQVEALYRRTLTKSR